GNGGARDEAQEFAACHVPAAQTVSTNPKEDSGEHDVSQPPAPLRGPEAATPQLSVSAMRLEVLVSGGYHVAAARLVVRPVVVLGQEIAGLQLLHALAAFDRLGHAREKLLQHAAIFGDIRLRAQRLAVPGNEDVEVQ